MEFGGTFYRGHLNKFRGANALSFDFSTNVAFQSKPVAVPILDRLGRVYVLANFLIGSILTYD